MCSSPIEAGITSLDLIVAQNIYAVEKGFVIAQGREEKCNKKWKQWSLFVFSREYGCALVEGE